MTFQSGVLCISVTSTHFLGRQDFFGSWISYQNLQKCFKELLSLVGYLVHLRHSWQNVENDKGPSMGSRIKRFEYRKFPLSGKGNCTQFCKITTGHGNTIEDLANMMVFFCWYGILFLYMPKHGLFLFQKRLLWPSVTILRGFDHMITLSVLMWDVVTEVHWIKFHHRI